MASACVPTLALATAGTPHVTEVQVTSAAVLVSTKPWKENLALSEKAATVAGTEVTVLVPSYTFFAVGVTSSVAGLIENFFVALVVEL